RVMTQGCQRTSRMSIILFNYFTGCEKPQKMHFSRVFHWVTSRFRTLRKNGLGYSKNENECIIHDDLPFIWYIIDYCGASSSPDHCTQILIKFRKGVFSIIGDVMHVIAAIAHRSTVVWAVRLSIG